eukprot:941615-Heterocapsa_arctica.AAC.1
MTFVGIIFRKCLMAFSTCCTTTAHFDRIRELHAGPRSVVGKLPRSQVHFEGRRRRPLRNQDVSLVSPTGLTRDLAGFKTCLRARRSAKQSGGHAHL